MNHIAHLYKAHRQLIWHNDCFYVLDDQLLHGGFWSSYNECLFIVFVLPFPDSASGNFFCYASF